MQWLQEFETKNGYKFQYLFGIILLGWSTRFLFLKAPRDAWHDEAFQWIFSQKPIAFILTGNDVHPPLFNILAKIMLWVTTDIFALRYMILVISLYFLYYSFRMTLKVFDAKTAYYATAMLALSPVFIYYATEFRNYQFALLVIACQILAFNVMLKEFNLKNRATYIILSLIAVYTHYLTGLIIFTQFVYLFVLETDIAKDFKDFIRQYFLKVFLPMAVGMIPLFYYISLMLPRIQSFWFKNIGWHSLISTFAYYVSPPLDKITGVASFMYIALVIGLVYFRKQLTMKHTQFIMYLVLPPLIMLAISMTSFQFYHHRYFLFGGISLYVLVGWVLARWDDIEPNVGSCMVGFFAVLVMFAFAPLTDANNTELLETSIFIENYTNTYPGNYVLVHDSTFSQSPMKVYLPYLPSYLVTNLTRQQLFTAGGSAIGATELCPDLDCVYAMEQGAMLLYISDKPKSTEVIYGNNGIYVSKI